MRGAAILLALLLPLLAHAAVETYAFAEEQQRLRYLEFTRELRCPKCQNQNLADSNAPIATDLRRELHRLLTEGRSDEEIVEFMVSRYGDYVLYKPRLEPRTWFLWGAPVLLLLTGALVVAGLVRRARAERAGAPPQPLSDHERERLAALLREREPRA